jgi:hypothetical protein
MIPPLFGKQEVGPTVGFWMVTERFEYMEGLSRAVTRRRTDNTMAKRKRQKDR